MPNLSAASTTTSQPSLEAWLQLLSHLSHLTDLPFMRERAAQAVDNALRLPGDLLEQLAAAASEVGLQVSPARLTLRDAIWKADLHLPIVIWCAPEAGWLVLRKHGFFRARVSSPDRPVEIHSITRRDLAHRLGLGSMDETIEVGIVAPKRPVEALGGRSQTEIAHSSGSTEASAETTHGHHAHSGTHSHHGLSPIRRFMGLLRPEMSDIWTIIIFSLITGLLYLALPLAVNALVSNIAFGSQSGPFVQALLVLGIVLFAALALAAALRGLQYYLVEVIQRRLFVRMTADLAHRLPRVDLRSIDGIHAPELVNRFLDVVTMQKNTALLLLTGINLVLSALIGMTVLAFYHPFLLAFSLVLLGLLSLIIFALGRGAIGTSVRESICKYEVVGWLEELARYPRLFKGPGGYDFAASRADDLARSYLAARRNHFRILMRQIMGLLTIEVVASAALLTVGGWLVIRQQLTLGQLVAAEIILTAIVASISKLGKQFEAWYDTLAAVDKLGHLVDLQTERENGETPPLASGPARLEARQLGFEYEPGHPVFSNVTFTLEPGEHVALFGSQGSGSSTMLDLLHGLRQPTQGHVAIDGLDLRSWYLESLRTQAMLIRDTHIVAGSIADNVRLGRLDISIFDVNQALRLAGLLHDVLEFPEGIHTPLLTGGLPLSSRQRIRLLVARALAGKPRLLLLDEVLDGLDKDSMEEIATLLFNAERQWTILISTRDEAVLRRCPRVIDLDAAECHGTH